ncbi:hypothetical protein [Pedobacter frigidisoli]|uniref:hypothetical protein n=1 Tax=Pedobacter frigidisoli TaxID=2530455 RepID=UPI00292CB4F4|nr:hypothetical protein [Pedobacter frigidisoli]
MKKIWIGLFLCIVGFTVTAQQEYLPMYASRSIPVRTRDTVIKGLTKNLHHVDKSVARVNGNGMVHDVDVQSPRTFLGIQDQGETLASVTNRDNHTHANISLSNVSTPNPNTSGADADYGRLGFFNSDFGIENVRLEGFYGSGQFVDRGGLKIYTRDHDGLQPRMVVGSGGHVGIGTFSSENRLTVAGRIGAQEIKVSGQNMPDYVFKTGYRNLSLREIEQYINLNKHLPEVPSAVEADQNGIELGEMNRLLLKKIEELTLHLINHEHQLELQEIQLTKALNELKRIKKRK